MDPQTKSAIKQLVLDLRHTLEDELAIVLRRYGVFTDRKWSQGEPPARLTDEADRETWQRIVAVVRQHMKERRTVTEATQDYVRESAFTFLNRLVGLKCLEVRGIIDEVITARDIYGGRSRAHRDFREEHPREARAADDALPACLEAACRHVNQELIGYLFDPDDDHSLVWPRYPVLKSCIEKINALRPAQDDALDEAVWREDEIIGWIYQFYNAEEKVAIRKRGKPQTPHDVAVINQFFTPRWIVKFLVDNTLGRLWLEMHPDSPRVREKCDYLVPELLPQGEQGKGETGRGGDGERASSGFILDPDSPINNPNAATRREAKPITRIKLLDPACGTMHFGHYACEVFEAMYRDARDWGEVKITDERIPSAILEYNLFGVDIDRRAVQLAALSLFMKARTMHPKARVRQVNLVVADATMPDSGVKKRFLARYARTPTVQKAFAQVLDDMDNVAQVGSLLRVEERLRELLTEAGHAAVDAFDLRRQGELPGMEPDARQMGLAELAEEDQATAWIPHHTLQEIRDDLRAFAREALQEHDVNAQLFATEADKAARLLDVLMGEYDVVVMNPPYGYPLQQASQTLKQSYPNSSINLLCAFLERAQLDLVSNDGYTGALLDRTFMVKSSYERFRTSFLLSSTSLMVAADLGWQVLDDAQVETVAIVLGGHQHANSSVFMDVRENPESQINFCALASNKRFAVSQQDFLSFPNSALAYKTAPSVRRAFALYPPLDPTVCTACKGVVPCRAEDMLFFWEFDNKLQRGSTRWHPIANGGSYSPFYRSIDQIIEYTNDGEALRQCGGMRNPDFQLKAGITYGKRTDYLNVQYLSAGNVFSQEGQSIFPHDLADRDHLICYLNSRLLRYTINLIAGQHKTSGYVGLLPYRRPDPHSNELLNKHARLHYELRKTWDAGNEICTRFSAPWLLQLAQPESEAFAQGLGRVLELLGDDAPPAPQPPGSLAPLPPGSLAPLPPGSLAPLLDRVRAIEEAADARLQALQSQIDEAVYDLYEISPEDRALIERELGDRPPELVWPQLEGKSDKEKRREHVRRFFSYFALHALRQDADGIVPLAGHAGAEPTLVDRVRAQLEGEFGPAVAYQLEQDAAEYLGRPLEEWLHRTFFAQFHVKLYKSRPILWHLTSPRGHFAVMLDYHQLDHDTLPKVRGQYLWPALERARTQLRAARDQDPPAMKLIGDLEAFIADLEECDRRLETVIQGAVEVDLPEWATGPYRAGQPPYAPDLDDGVKVNILPLQAAGLLPVKKGV